MILNRRSVQQLWNKKIQKRVKSGEAICTWNNFDDFLAWYQNEVINLPDEIYFVDFLIGNWNNLNGQLLISPDTTYIITKEIYDNIRDINPRRQLRDNNPCPIGVTPNPTTFSPYITTPDKRHLIMGNYSTAEEAFYVYKYYKENIMKSLAQDLYNQGRINQRTFNAVYNLPIISVKVSLDNYNPEVVAQIAYNFDHRARPPVKFDSFEQEFLGCMYEQLDGWCKIIEVYPIGYIKEDERRYVRVQFMENPMEDGTPYTVVAYLHNVKAGHVKNPYKILSCGGYYGEGPYIANQDMKIYKAWDSMLRRAYTYTAAQSYLNCTVDRQWLNFQRFADWYQNYRIQLNPIYYSILDIEKDILQWGQSQKIYSPSTCCLVPHDLNNALTKMNDGNYSLDRKQKIKSLSIRYYNDGGITKDIYDVIMDNLRRF